MKLIKYPFVLMTLLLAMACGIDEEPSTDCIQGFDQKAMFENMATAIILPAYSQLKNQVDQLSIKGEAFTTNPSEATLLDLRSNFIAAYEQWQYAAPFEFGPAMDVFLRNSLNNFPVNVGQLENNIATGSWNFDAPDEYDKGLPALDYLLYGIANDDAEILAAFKEAPDAQKHRDYLTALIADIKTRVDKTTQAWEAYETTFTANTGTADGTSLSLIINSFNEHYELSKREKIGFPSGALTSGFPNPEAVEAYYSGHSSILLRKTLEASETISSQLKNYLDQVNAEKNGTPLSSLVKTQYQEIRTLADSFGSTSLSEIIATDIEKVNSLYQLISDQVVLIKTDLPSVLCVSITYIDNPSDSD